MPHPKYSKTDFERDINDGKISPPESIKEQIEKSNAVNIGTYSRQKHLKVFNAHYNAHLKAMKGGAK